MKTKIFFTVVSCGVIGYTQLTKAEYCRDSTVEYEGMPLTFKECYTDKNLTNPTSKSFTILDSIIDMKVIE